MMVSSDNNGNVLIVELIRRDINNQSIKLKPRMRISVAIAKYILRLTAFVILKVLCKEQGSVPARTKGEVLLGHTERFRFALHNCPAKGSCKLKQFGFISFDQSTNELFVTRTHPMMDDE